jgi:predicted RNase H-like nuclease (RuvC/YqgF family)
LVKEIKNLRESVDRLEEENQNLKEQIADIWDELYAYKAMFTKLRRNNPKLYKEARNYMAFENV